MWICRRSRIDLVAPTLTWTDWSLDPSVVGGVVALAVGYLAAVRHGYLAPSDDVSAWFPSVRWRVPTFFAGLAILVLALQSPIDRGGDEYLLSVHMVQHLLLMMVVPPLLLLGIVRTAPRGPLVFPRTRRLWRGLTRPWTATLLFNVALLAWHFPALYDAALTAPPIHVAEHLTFLAAGVIFWWPVVDPLRGAWIRLVTAPQKIAILTVAGVPPTILGLILALAVRPFYDFYAVAPRLWGLTPVADQQIAGVIMFGAGNLIYFAAISVIFLRLSGDPADDERAAAATLFHHPARMQGNRQDMLVPSRRKATGDGPGAS